MSAENKEYEAMVVPRGARIITGEGGKIELDVQGDLILQESQKGLTSLSSHHGSILIDENVDVRSQSISARHLIRVRGRLETDDIRAASISLEGGEMRSGEVNTDSFESRDGELEIHAINARRVVIDGGQVEIGAINSEVLRLQNNVRGAILISSASDRQIDDSVRVKGGFESDVELLGYLLKYRKQVMSDRVMQELRARKEGREFQRFLLRESALNDAKQSGEQTLEAEARIAGDTDAGADSSPQQRGEEAGAGDEAGAGEALYPEGDAGPQGEE